MSPATATTRACIGCGGRRNKNANPRVGANFLIFDLLLTAYRFTPLAFARPIGPAPEEKGSGVRRPWQSAADDSESLGVPERLSQPMWRVLLLFACFRLLCFSKIQAK
jgi:hypothetical protein